MTIDMYMAELAERIQNYGLMKLVAKTGMSFRTVQQVVKGSGGNPRVDTLREIEKGLSDGN